MSFVFEDAWTKGTASVYNIFRFIASRERERERRRETDRHTDRQKDRQIHRDRDRESNSNMKTLFSKYCDLGSVKTYQLVLANSADE